MLKVDELVKSYIMLLRGTVFESVYGIMNEHQLSIGETTCHAKVDNIRPEPGKRIFYSSSLARVALERCRKAREAVKLIGSLIDQYGYYGTGECLVLADPEEAWVIEMCGYDVDGSNGLWVAQHIPDDGVFVSANQFRIREVKKNSPDIQSRSWLPDPVGGLMWVGFDKPAESCLEAGKKAAVSRLPDDILPRKCRGCYKIMKKTLGTACRKIQ